jgi:hypothetical protein
VDNSVDNFKSEVSLMPRIRIDAVSIGKNFSGKDILRMKVMVEGEKVHKSVTINYNQDNFGLTKDRQHLERLKNALGTSWQEWNGRILDNAKIVKRGRNNTILLED